MMTQVKVTKESQPNWHAALTVYRKVFGETLPLMMISRRACIDKKTRKPMLWVGFMPYIKIGLPEGGFRPNIRVDSKRIEFYNGLEWIKMKKPDFIKKLKEMDKQYFRQEPADKLIKYLPDEDAYVVTGYLGE